MEELLNLSYKDEVEALKEEENFEALGDAKYMNHHDKEARLYWAFCRPSGSHPNQIDDPDPLVSIMAFNHSRLPALPRFKHLHPEVIADTALRKKIGNRTRMLFRDLTDHDFVELNQLLDLFPVFLPIAIDQLKNGRKWNDIPADTIEASLFLKRSTPYHDNDFFKALFAKLTDIEEFTLTELKTFLTHLISTKDQIDPLILDYFKEQSYLWVQESDLHILQRKGVEKLIEKLNDRKLQHHIV